MFSVGNPVICNISHQLRGPRGVAGGPNGLNRGAGGVCAGATPCPTPPPNPAHSLNCSMPLQRPSSLWGTPVSGIPAGAMAAQESDDPLPPIMSSDSASDPLPPLPSEQSRPIPSTRRSKPPPAVAARTNRKSGASGRARGSRTSTVSSAPSMKRSGGSDVLRAGTQFGAFGESELADAALYLSDSGSPTTPYVVPDSDGRLDADTEGDEDDDYIFIFQHGDRKAADPNATWVVAKCDVEYYENIDWHLETATALPPAVQQVPILSVNRYKDILPNPRTRVPLKRVGNDPISEYINANFVRGPDGNPHHYICTMGPLPETIDAFWRMTWEQRPAAIVMITQLMEQGRPKCAPYWPEDIGGDPIEFSPGLSVVAVSATTHNGYTKTMLRVTKGGESFDVGHFHFLAWPDHGIPDNTEDCLALVKGVNRYVADRVDQGATPKAPVVVHCSAGVGRTGTYIALDHCMHELVATRRTDPLTVIQTIRNDRSALVQHPLQYVFLHKCAVDFGRENCKKLLVEKVSKHAVVEEGAYESHSDDEGPTWRRSNSYSDAIKSGGVLSSSQTKLMHPAKGKPAKPSSGCPCTIL